MREAPKSRTDRDTGTDPQVVIGLGNPYRGDDGVVSVLFETLREAASPPEVPLIERGDATLGVLHLLIEYDSVLLVDAVRFGGEPGDHVVFTPEEAVSRVTASGTHESDLLEIVELADQVGDGRTEVRIFGIQPGTTEWGNGLSPQLAERVPELIRELEKAIRKQ